MKIINEVEITVNGKTTLVYVKNGERLKIRTKAGDMVITSVNKHSGVLAFEHNGDEVLVPFEGPRETLAALFRVAGSISIKELVLLKDRCDYLTNQELLGEYFMLDGRMAAYRYPAC